MTFDLEPFRIEVASADLDEFRARLRNTRWPDQEQVGDWSQGVPRHWLEQLCRQWAEEYDWRLTERRLNQIPSFAPRSTA